MVIPSHVRRLLSLLVALATLLWVVTASAKYTPPPINGHVMDQAGVLTADEVLKLDSKLESARLTNGFAIVVFIPTSLEDETIQDVAYTAFNTWKVGSVKADDGVLLVIAPKERKTWIETGKGVGGGLTDIGSAHIARDTVNPLLKQGRYYDAVDQGTDAILKELIAGTPGGQSEAGKGKAKRGRPHAQSSTTDMLKVGALILVVIAVIVLAIISPTFREILFFFLLFGRGGGGGGGAGGGGGGGGSGYGGGGGSSGGGGGGDDW